MMPSMGKEALVLTCNHTRMYHLSNGPTTCNPDSLRRPLIAWYLPIKQSPTTTHYLTIKYLQPPMCNLSTSYRPTIAYHLFTSYKLIVKYQLHPAYHLFTKRHRQIESQQVTSSRSTSHIAVIFNWTTNPALVKCISTPHMRIASAHTISQDPWTHNQALRNLPFLKILAAFLLAITVPTMLTLTRRQRELA